MLYLLLPLALERGGALIIHRRFFRPLCPALTQMEMQGCSDQRMFYAVRKSIAVEKIGLLPRRELVQRVISLDIDDRLRAGDVTLVSEIQKVTINGVEKNFYSFATKYSSHHRPLDFPIYDSYVEKVMCYFRDRDKFASFRTPELKNYKKFKGTLINFRAFYGLDQYNLKEIDKYIWQLGKEYLLENYGKKKDREEPR